MKPQFYSNNRQKLSKLIGNKAVALIHSNPEQFRSADQFFPFRQSSNLLYFTGIDQPDTWLLLCPGHNNPAMREIIFSRQPTRHQLLWNGPTTDLQDIAQISGVEHCLYTSHLDDMLKALIAQADEFYVDVPENEIAESTAPSYIQKWINTAKDIHSEIVIESLVPLEAGLRCIKLEPEIAQIRKACNLARNAFFDMLPVIKSNNYEYQVRAAVVHSFLNAGATGESFDTIAASGKNACILHYCTNQSKMHDGDLLLVDYGAELQYYASDVTRTFPVSGKFSPRQRELYKATLRVMQQLEHLFVAGNTINHINHEIGMIWEVEHIKLGLYTSNQARYADSSAPLWKQYFPHGVSHFLGMDVHDIGSRDEVFAPGMVLTIEPGIYIPEEGIGIRLENDLLITNGLPENLTRDIPIDPEEIEDLMAE
jgi:Xaa-Pro aminopeptidase